MNILKRLSIKSKLVLLLLVFVTGFAAFGVTSFMLTKELQVNGPVYGEIVTGKDLIADILPPPEYIIESYLLVLQLAKTKDMTEIGNLEDRLKLLKADYDTRHEFWVDLLPQGEMKRKLVEASYQPAVKFYNIVETDFLSAVRLGNLQEANRLVDSRLATLYEEHRSAIDKVVLLATQANSDIEKSATEKILTGTIVLLTITLATLLAVSILGIWITRQIVGPVRSLNKVADDVAMGNVNVNIDINSSDDIGKLADSFRSLVDYMKTLEVAAAQIAENNLTVQVEPKSDKDALGHAFKWMATNLCSMVKELGDNASQLVSAATEIASTSEQMSHGAQQQTDQTAQVSSAVEEMSATILETTKNAGDTANTAKQAATAARDGASIVSETMSGMNRIAEVVQKSARTIQNLAKSSDKIGEIISVIDDIADQTNLLALNAAIEAARAGDQGRGFAVVADEVRKLAERTTKATKEITDMIRGIQTDTIGAVASMQEGIAEVDNGRALADKAGESLNAILDYAQRVQEMVGQIAAASEQQSTASSQIAINIESIANVTKDNASGVEQAAAAAEQLSRQAEGLSAMVSRFKLSGCSTTTIALAKSDHLKYKENLRNTIDGR